MAIGDCVVCTLTDDPSRFELGDAAWEAKAGGVEFPKFYENVRLSSTHLGDCCAQVFPPASPPLNQLQLFEMAAWIVIVGGTALTFYFRRNMKPLSARLPVHLFARVSIETLILLCLVVVESEGLPFFCPVLLFIKLVAFPALSFVSTFAVLRLGFLFQWTEAKIAFASHFDNMKTQTTLPMPLSPKNSRRFSQASLPNEFVNFNAVGKKGRAILGWTTDDDVFDLIAVGSSKAAKDSLQWFYTWRFILTTRFFVLAFSTQIAISLTIYLWALSYMGVAVEATATDSAQCEFWHVPSTYYDVQADPNAVDLRPDLSTCHLCGAFDQGSVGTGLVRIFNYIILLVGFVGLWRMRKQGDDLFLQSELYMFYGGTVLALIMAELTAVGRVVHVYVWWSFFTSCLFPTLLSFASVREFFLSSFLTRMFHTDSTTDSELHDIEMGPGIAAPSDMERMHYGKLRAGINLLLVDLYINDAPSLFFVLAHNVAYSFFYEFAKKEFTVENLQFIQEVRAWKHFYIQHYHCCLSTSCGGAPSSSNPMHKNPALDSRVVQSNRHTLSKACGSGKSNEYLFEKAKWIIKKFVAPGAYLEVNISHMARAQLLSCQAYEECSKNVLVVMDQFLCIAEEEILALTERDSFQRFRKCRSLFRKVEKIFKMEQRFFKYASKLESSDTAYSQSVVSM